MLAISFKDFKTSRKTQFEIIQWIVITYYRFLMNDEWLKKLDHEFFTIKLIAKYVIKEKIEYKLIFDKSWLISRYQK